MEKTLRTPIMIAVIGFIAGGIVLGTLGVSAHEGGARIGDHGRRGETVAQVLGVDIADLRNARQGGSFEEFVLANGFDSLDDFDASLQSALVEKWETNGISEEEIADRLDNMTDRHEARDAMREITADMLGVSEEELQSARGEGHEAMDLLIEAAGYEDHAEFRDAVSEALDELGIETPHRQGFGPMGHRGGPKL